MTTPKLHAHRRVLPSINRPDCYSPPLGGKGTRPRRYIMRRLHLFIALLGALIIPLGGLVTASPAMAYDLAAVYKDCEVHGQLTGHYPRAQLQAALNALPAQVAEYSACSDVIRQALLRSSSSGGGNYTSNHATLAGGSHRGGGGSGSGKGSTRGHAGRTHSSSVNSKGRSGVPAGANAVTLAGSDLRPGSTGAGASSLPATLIVVLILLALTALSGGAVAIRRRVLDARHGT